MKNPARWCWFRWRRRSSSGPGPWNYAEHWTHTQGKAAEDAFYQDEIDGTAAAHQDSEHFRGIDVQRVREDHVPLPVLRSEESAARRQARGQMEAAGRYRALIRKRTRSKGT